MEVFGRTNNAYRWAGETDVFEALQSVRERYRIDPDRIALRGFSMGGAGTWHIGLHYPDEWMATEAGAGFTETKIYAKQKDLPPYQEAPLSIYDAVDYSLNAFDVPTVGYGGEIDPQLQASTNIREQLVKEGFHFKAEPLKWTGLDLRAIFLVGPQTPHKFHPDSKAISDQFINAAAADGRRAPDHIRFVTYTTRYNRCFWVTVDALEKHYQRAEVDAVRSADHSKLTIKTTNVARLALPPAASISIDGQKLKSAAFFEKSGGKWKGAAALAPGSRKQHGLQGPIDDAFMDAFLVVKPSGSPRNPQLGAWAARNLEQFQAEYARFLRGDVVMKSDTAVTEGDIAGSNLVLFGDPESNVLLRRIASRLPVAWPAESDQALSLICPNPLNPKRYVVINSGHTFHRAELEGTNALLFPRLGDYGIFRVSGEGASSLLTAGLLDENWKRK